MKKLFISFILILSLVFAMTPTAFAAKNVCSSSVKGNASSAKTFTVTTKGKWFKSTKLTLTQNKKGVAIGSKLSGRSKTYNTYAKYKVTYTNSKGKRKTVSFSGKNKTINLSKNETYTIKVAPDNTGLHLDNAFKNGGFYGWKTVPTWTVKSTGGNISYCN